MRYEKFKDQQVPALAHHMFREYQGAAPANVRSDYSSDNLTFGKETSEQALETYQSELRRLEEKRKKEQGRGLRSDAVTVVDCVIQMPKGYSEDDEPEFFAACYDILRERHGEPLWATVHVDEGRPHLHFGFMPIDDKGNLNAKKVISRDFLSTAHDEMDRALRKECKWYHGGIVHEDPNERLTARLKESHTREFRDQVVDLREMREKAEQAKKDGLQAIAEERKREEDALAAQRRALERDRQVIMGARDSLQLIEVAEEERKAAFEEMVKAHDALVGHFSEYGVTDKPTKKDPDEEERILIDDFNNIFGFHDALVSSFSDKGHFEGWKDKALEEVERVWEPYQKSHEENMARFHTAKDRRPSLRTAWETAKAKVRTAFQRVADRLRTAKEKVVEVVAHPIEEPIRKETMDDWKIPMDDPHPSSKGKNPNETAPKTVEHQETPETQPKAKKKGFSLTD